MGKTRPLTVPVGTVAYHDGVRNPVKLVYPDGHTEVHPYTVVFGYQHAPDDRMLRFRAKVKRRRG